MRIVGTVLLSVLGAAVGVGIIIAILTLAAPSPRNPDDASETPAKVYTYASPAPLVKAVTPAGPGISGLADPAWVASTAKATGIPARALAAYAGMAINQDAATSCGMSWNLLAGIGEVESRHGQIFGGTIAANGTVSPPIFGVPLSGVTTANIPDTDKGTIDGDATIDRAVGPMQLIPETWRNWHVDGSGDGVEDPQNIDDATMAASHYLCRAGKDVASQDGFQRGVLAYNGSQQYLQDVAGYAVRYAKAAAG